MKIPLLALSTGVFLISNTAYAEPTDCNNVLKLQEFRDTSNYNLNMAYLHLINEDNYENAKQSAKASYSDIFSGSWDDFKVKRQKRFEELNYKVDLNDSREVYRASLAPEQIAGWISCMRQAAQPIVWYGHADKLGADLEIEWQPNEDLGPFKKPDFVSSSGAAQRLPNEVIGRYGFHISRNQAGEAISGSINGFTRNYFWEQKQLRSVRIFVPEIKDMPVETPPEKIIMPMDNQVLSSWAYWAGKHYPENFPRFRREFVCFSGVSGMDLVKLGADSVTHLPRGLKGYCVPKNSDFCDARDELCTDIAVSKGCLVSSTWHKWYKTKVAASGLEYSASQVCGSGG